MPIATMESPKPGSNMMSKKPTGCWGKLPELGIGIDNVTRQLEDEGVEKFIKPFDKLNGDRCAKVSTAFDETSMKVSHMRESG